MKPVIIIAVVFVLLIPFPILAQEEHDEQTSIEVQNILVDFNSILFTIVASIIGSFIGGTLLGKYLSGYEELRKERKEVNTLHTLLNSDFTTCKRMIVSNLKKQKKTLDYFNDNEKSKKDKPKMINLFEVFTLNEYFPFRKIIEKSGTLIKLDPSEMKTIQVIYESLDNLVKNMFEERKKFLEHSSSEDVLPLLNYVNLIYHVNLNVLDAINLVEPLDWIDLNKEVRVPHIAQVEKSSFRDSEEIKQDWTKLFKEMKNFYEIDGILNEIKELKKELKKIDEKGET